MSNVERVGLVGVGAMGAPIARALLDAGSRVFLYDPNPDAARALAVDGAVSCSSVREVADSVATVFVSLPTPEIVREVVAGKDGLLEGSAIRTIVDLSTTGTTTTRDLAYAAQQAKVAYLDAPVSGGVAGAEARTLAVIASGDSETFESVRPLLEAFGGSVFLVGPLPGQGQLTKLLNNLLSATALAITCEATVLAVRAGLDPATLLEVVSASSGRNTATTHKFPEHVLTGRFSSGFRLALMAKDVELCLAEARQTGSPMLLGGLVQQLWTLAAANASEGADHTEIVRLFESWGDVTVAAAYGGGG